MRVALTGTPGTGKSAVGSILQKQGYLVVPLYELAVEAKCITGEDDKRKTKLIDTTALNRYIKKRYVKEETIFFEGHISHLLRTMEKICILRCHPNELKTRLLKKQWPQQKIQENLDAETLDVILCEAVELHRAEDIFEIDTTKRSIREVAGIITKLTKSHFRPTKTYRVGQIDWSEELIVGLSHRS